MQSYIAYVFAYDCFIIPPFYFYLPSGINKKLKLIFHCKKDALSLTVLLKVEVQCCDHHSQRQKGVQKLNEIGAEKIELATKKFKCFICKQVGHTKRPCPNKEKIFTSNILKEGILCVYVVSNKYLFCNKKKNKNRLRIIMRMALSPFKLYI